MDAELGKEINRIRKMNKYTLKDVSEKSGLSVSFLSQVERGVSSVTFTSLRRIAEALGVHINLFFEEPQEKSPLKKQTIKKTADQPNFTFTNLVGDMEKPLFYPARIELRPGESHTHPYAHEGQEFVYILEGQLKVILEDYSDTFYANESFHIDSMQEHIWFNETEKPVTLLVVSATIHT
ncbi:transcriptional regulator [Sporosarcina sp. P37]|uniref:helix-turn-helix domain-containing protein n=1 Tax=unclassified Sporosarcina TaxID=2647733 RepID=UPI0009BE2430|nr:MULTISPECIES: XRE family transcriptional regulator [unclassified Sporosarcina]ARD47093.1 transcriptional regulator [Sporosarcina sp. P33]ARK23642.1 transcriptional regulator [Sporosarcina sp. P37]PID18735.1 XRE family transcriptional regulator [Sporosarcina sp. P35]